MTSRRASPGFSLVELMIALGLFTAIAASLLAFQGMVLGSRNRSLGQTTLGNHVTIIRRAFAAAVESSSYVARPGPGASSPALTALSNCADDGVTPLAAGLPATFSHLCVDAAGQNIYLYQGAAPAPAIVCGADPGAGVTRTAVAGGEAFAVTTINFNRPLDTTLVQLDLLMGLDVSGAHSEKSMSIQAALNHAQASN